MSEAIIEVKNDIVVRFWELANEKSSNSESALCPFRDRTEN